jgi:hypothetical protein
MALPPSSFVKPTCHLHLNTELMQFQINHILMDKIEHINLKSYPSLTLPDPRYSIPSRPISSESAHSQSTISLAAIINNLPKREVLLLGKDIPHNGALGA